MEQLEFVEVTTEQVDQAFKQAIDAGARPLKTPRPVFWGGYSGYFSDPDGHVWDLAMNPYGLSAPMGL